MCERCSVHYCVWILSDLTSHRISQRRMQSPILFENDDADDIILFYNGRLCRERIPVAERSNARVYGRLLARMAGLISAGYMDVCLLSV